MGIYPNLPSSLLLYIDIFHENGKNPLPIYSQLSNFVGRFKIFKPLDMLSPNPNHNLSTTSPQGIPSDPPVVLTPDLPVTHHSKDQYLSCCFVPFSKNLQFPRLVPCGQSVLNLISSGGHLVIALGFPYTKGLLTTIREGSLFLWCWLKTIWPARTQQGNLSFGIFLPSIVLF